MAWGIKYQVEFDPTEVTNPTSPVYTINLMKKGWTGNIKRPTAAGAPVIHSWQTDDPRAPIKGSSLQINLISGSIPLIAFYTDEDDGYKVQLYKNNQKIFEGFLVQDDCSEDLAEWKHEVNLSANDNLGLLKDVPLDQAPTIYIPQFSSSVSFTSLYAHTLTVPDAFWANLAPGYQLVISGGTTVDGTYTIDSLLPGSGGNSFVFLNEIIQNSSGTETGTIQVNANTSFQQRMTLLSLIHICLRTTGLELETHIYANLLEESHSVSDSFLAQTLIDSQTFLKNDTDYDDCYTVLTKILDRFNLTLFQSLGVWNIVRWDELRYANNQVKGFAYDSDMNLIGNVMIPGPFQSGINQPSVAETGMIQKIFRPYKFVKETFNYKQPPNLLRNYNLKELGTLVSQITSGTGTSQITTSEYEVPWWVWENAFPSAGSAAYYVIRIVTDYTGTEISRVLFVKTNEIHSYKIEVNQNDTFKLNISFRTIDSIPGPSTFVFYVKLTDGTTTKFLQSSTSATPGWQNGVGWSYTIASGDNANVWHTVEIDSNFAPIPFDGLMYVYLRTNNSNGTEYRDLRLEYIPSINSSTKVIGHTHTDSQNLSIKNKEDEEIFMDSSPRNSIVGTLFLNSMTGVLQTRAGNWKRGHLTESKKLGEITTLERLYYRRIPRTILDGSLFGWQDYVSMLSVFRYTWFTNINFQWGQLEIDYKNRLMTGTLWEAWQDQEVEADLIQTYEFNYLYDTK